MVFVRRDLDVEHIRDQILDRRDDEPYAYKVFQVVFQCIEKCRCKSFVCKDRDKVVETDELDLTHSGPVGKSQHEYAQDRQYNEYRIEDKSGSNKEQVISVFSFFPHILASLSVKNAGLSGTGIRCVTFHAPYGAGFKAEAADHISFWISSQSSSTVISPVKIFVKSSPHTVDAFPVDE